MKHQASFGRIVIAILWLLAGCAGANPDENREQIDSITYSLSDQPGNIDPHIMNDDKAVIPIRQIYDTLLYRDPQTKDFVPGLATSWIVSEDSLSYTFKLREDVRFHDGTIFNAQAVASNLDRIISANVGRASKLLGPYSQYRIINDYTIQLVLREPYAPLLDALSQVYLGIASPAAFGQYSPNRYQFHQVGTGPFALEDYVPGERITLKRNPLYTWGPVFYKVSDNPINKITFQLGERLSQQILESRTGFIGEVTPLDARQLAQNPSILILPILVAGQPIQFMINTQQFPTNNLNVRQALLYATNRNRIVDTIYQRFSPVAWGPLSANSPYSVRGWVGVYANDLTQTQSLLSSIGYQDNDKNGILEIGGIDLSISILIPPWDELSQVGQVIADQWRIAGIRVVLEPLPTLSRLKERVVAGNYNLAPIYASDLDPVFLGEFYGSDSDGNWSKYADTSLDEILRQAAQQSDVQLRRELYNQAQQIIMNNALILPIQDQFILIAVSSRLEGLAFDAYGIPIFNNVGIRGE